MKLNRRKRIFALHGLNTRDPLLAMMHTQCSRDSMESALVLQDHTRADLDQTYFYKYEDELSVSSRLCHVESASERHERKFVR